MAKPLKDNEMTVKFKRIYDRVIFIFHGSFVVFVREDQVGAFIREEIGARESADFVMEIFRRDMVYYRFRLVAGGHKVCSCSPLENGVGTFRELGAYPVRVGDCFEFNGADEVSVVQLKKGRCAL